MTSAIGVGEWVVEWLHFDIVLRFCVKYQQAVTRVMCLLDSATIGGCCRNARRYLDGSSVHQKPLSTELSVTMAFGRRSSCFAAEAYAMRGKSSRTGRPRVRTVCGRSVVARVGAIRIALSISVVLSHVRFAVLYPSSAGRLVCAYCHVVC